MRGKELATNDLCVAQKNIFLKILGSHRESLDAKAGAEGTVLSHIDLSDYDLSVELIRKLLPSGCHALAVSAPRGVELGEGTRVSKHQG